MMDDLMVMVEMPIIWLWSDLVVIRDLSHSLLRHDVCLFPGFLWVGTIENVEIANRATPSTIMATIGSITTLPRVLIRLCPS